MKLTKSKLKQIIKEELKTALNEEESFQVPLYALTNLVQSGETSTDINLPMPGTYPRRSQPMTLTVSQATGSEPTLGASGSGGVSMSPNTPIRIAQLEDYAFTLA